MDARAGAAGDPEATATGSCEGEGTAEGAGLFLNSASARRRRRRLALRFPPSCLFHFPLPETVAASARARAARALMGSGRGRGPQAWPPGGVRELTGGGWLCPAVAFPRCRGSGAEALTRQDTPSLRVSSLSQVVVSLEGKTQNASPSLVR